ncbi:MAG: DUF3841 domain-containing protein [Chloroflexota bacterium]|nr:DUF3841 domain-containing protein [Chloroflexota bacterium]
MEFEVDAKRVLLSDFDLWHYVINYWYIHRREAEDTAFEHLLKARGLDYYTMKPLPDPAYHRRIEESGERIFDIEWQSDFVRPEGLSGASIQATLWELPLECAQCHGFFSPIVTRLSGAIIR